MFRTSRRAPKRLKAADEIIRHKQLYLNTPFFIARGVIYFAVWITMAALLRLSPRPTAVVASNDWTAIGALHAIDAAGLRVPEDISLVGFDDIPLVSYTNPALTSVRMSAADVGATAFNALFSLIGGDRLEGDTYQVATRLVVRESTAKPHR